MSDLPVVDLVFYNRYDTSIRPDVNERSGVYVTTTIRQPKVVWDEIHKKAKVTKLRFTGTGYVKGSLAAFRRMVAHNVFVKVPGNLAANKLGYGDLGDAAKRIGDLRYVVVFSDNFNILPRIKESYCLRVTVRSGLVVPGSLLGKDRQQFLNKAVRVEGNPTDSKVASIFVLEQYDLNQEAKREWEGLNLIWAFYLNADGVKSHEIKVRRTYDREYGLIRGLVAKERPGHVYRWQNLCRELSSKSNLVEIRKYAQLFGLPPQTWNNPRLMCALMTPRVEDYAEKIHCDNADEPTMEGDEVGGIPEYLKYTFTDVQGKVYCSNVLDLYKAIRSGQSHEPYRRFAFTPEVKQDIEARYEWLKKVIEPHGLGQGILAKIRDTALALSPTGALRARLIHVWGKLHYPKYTIEEIMQADVATLNGIWAAMGRQDGIRVVSSEKNRYNAATNADERRTVLIDTMYRIVNIEDPSDSNLVALEEAINDSTPQGTVRARDEDEDAAEGVRRGAPVPRVDITLRVRDVPEIVRLLRILQNYLNLSEYRYLDFPIFALGRLLFQSEEQERDSDLSEVYHYLKDHELSLRDRLPWSDSEWDAFETFVTGARRGAPASRIELPSAAPVPVIGSRPWARNVPEIVRILTILRNDMNIPWFQIRFRDFPITSLRRLLPESGALEQPRDLPDVYHYMRTHERLRDVVLSPSDWNTLEEFATQNIVPPS